MKENAIYDKAEMKSVVQEIRSHNHEDAQTCASDLEQLKAIYLQLKEKE